LSVSNFLFIKYRCSKLKAQNNVSITGFVGQDPKIAVTEKATRANFSVGISMAKDVTTWVNVTAWHDVARMCEDLVKKGTEVIVYGELHVYKAENDKTFTSINAEKVRPLVRIEWDKYKKGAEHVKEEQAKHAAPPAFDIPDHEFKDDDLPF